MPYQLLHALLTADVEESFTLWYFEVLFLRKNGFSWAREELWRCFYFHFLGLHLVHGVPGVIGCFASVAWAIPGDWRYSQTHLLNYLFFFLLLCKLKLAKLLKIYTISFVALGYFIYASEHFISRVRWFYFFKVVQASRFKRAGLLLFRQSRHLTD